MPQYTAIAMSGSVNLNLKKIRKFINKKKNKNRIYLAYLIVCTRDSSDNACIYLYLYFTRKEIWIFRLVWHWSGTQANLESDTGFLIIDLLKKKKSFMQIRLLSYNFHYLSINLYVVNSNNNPYNPTHKKMCFH